MTDVSSWIWQWHVGLSSQTIAIPQEAINLRIPCFYGGAIKDQACPHQMMKAMMTPLVQNFTTKDFNTGHWVMHESPDEVNEALEGFFTTLIL